MAFLTKEQINWIHIRWTELRKNPKISVEQARLIISQEQLKKPWKKRKKSLTASMPSH